MCRRVAKKSIPIVTSDEVRTCQIFSSFLVLTFRRYPSLSGCAYERNLFFDFPNAQFVPFYRIQRQVAAAGPDILANDLLRSMNRRMRKKTSVVDGVQEHSGKQV